MTPDEIDRAIAEALDVPPEQRGPIWAAHMDALTGMRVKGEA